MRRPTFRVTPKLIALIALVATLLEVGSAPISYASTVVRGTLSTNDVLLVADNAGNVVGVYPSDFYIKYVYSYTYSTNETGEVNYEILSKGWWWSYPGEPPDTLNVPDAGLLLRLNYDVKFGANLGNKTETVDNVTTSIAGIDISLEVTIHIEFVRIPKVAGSIDIGGYLRKYLFGGRDPVISYYVTALKYVDGRPDRTIYISDDVVLSLDGLVANIHTISVYIDRVNLTRYNDSGSLDSFAVVSPVYDITVCGNVHGSSKTYSMIVTYGDKEAVLTIDGDPDPECTTIRNVSITPGNSTITLFAKSGSFVLKLDYNTTVEGAIVTLGKASGRAVGSPGKWKFTVTVPVSVYGHLGSGREFMITGSVSGDPIGSIPCQPLTINGTGSYTLLCNATVAFGGSADQISNATYSIHVIVTDELGSQHEFQGSFLVNAIDPTNIADIAWYVYDAAAKSLFMGVIMAVILMIFSILKETFTGSPLFDPSHLRGAMLTMIVAAFIIYIAIPYAYSTFIGILSSVPLFQPYVTPPQGSDPKTVFTHLVGYYDALFQAIESDYQSWYVANVQGIMNSAAFLAGIFAGLMIAAIIASLLPGGSIPFASVASALLSTIFAYLSIALTYAPAGAAIMVGVVLGRMVILITTVIITAVMTLGVFLIAIPTPLSQRLGEEMFGAGVLYFITFPLLAPISYSLYRYVLDTASRSISQSPLSIPLGIVSIFIPAQQIMNIMIYFIASGTAILMVMLTLGLILQRTGIATGIGEALSALFWRG